MLINKKMLFGIIAEIFNSRKLNTYREPSSLRTQWKNMKQDARKLAIKNKVKVDVVL